MTDTPAATTAAPPAAPQPAPGSNTGPDTGPDTGSDPRVSILVISYNTRAMTLGCLRSVIAETRAPYELVVLDNASPDGSAAAIAAEFPGIRLIASPDNHGFAGGNNRAARGARGAYLLLLNPDTLVLDGAVDRLLAFAARRPDAGIWGGRTLKADGTLDPGCVYADQTLWSLFCRTSGLALAFPGSRRLNPELYGGWARDSERAVDVVQGCFLLIRRDLWERLGGFDPSFVMYGEEADLCRRARALGAQPRMTPEATIVHYGGAASARRSDKTALVLKAKVTLARRYLPAWQRPLALFLLRMWPLGRTLAAGLAARVTGHAGAAAAARHWGAVWAARRDWQQGFAPLPPARPDADASAGGKPIYIAWIGFQRRAESVRQFLDVDLHYLPPPFAARWLKPLGYVVQAIRTARIVRAARPETVWVQSPPGFLPHLLLLLRRRTRPFRIVVDGHNSAFAPPWSRVPGAVWAMNRCDRVLVHNAEMRPVAEALGVRPGRIGVLEDPPPLLGPAPAPDGGGAPYVLVPCSFAADEPIPALLAAARLAPEIGFRITGSRRKAEARGFTAAAPGNVRFTGYLPVAEFEALLAGAAVVLGLTDREGVQLSVANEALGADRALVLSDTRILRAMFGEAALFARNTPESLAAALREALDRRDELRAGSAALRARRQARWRDEAGRAAAAQV